jgi:hypothetical protein
MAEKLFYYLLALTVAGGFLLVYDIVMTELCRRRECLERERLRMAYELIKRLSGYIHRAAGINGRARRRLW